MDNGTIFKIPYCISQDEFLLFRFKKPNCFACSMECTAVEIGNAFEFSFFTRYIAYQHNAGEVEISYTFT